MEKEKVKNRETEKESEKEIERIHTEKIGSKK